LLFNSKICAKILKGKIHSIKQISIPFSWFQKKNVLANKKCNKTSKKHLRRKEWETLTPSKVKTQREKTLQKKKIT
jgi:hypothetical protein